MLRGLWVTSSVFLNCWLWPWQHKSFSYCITPIKQIRIELNAIIPTSHANFCPKKTMFENELIKSMTANFSLYITWGKVHQPPISQRQTAGSVCTGWGQSGQPVCLGSQSAPPTLTHGCSCCTYQWAEINSHCSILGPPSVASVTAISIDLVSAQLQMSWSIIRSRLSAGLRGLRLAPDIHTCTCRRPHCCHVNISP